MTTKTPIEPGDIRKGDVVRWEATSVPKAGGAFAREYIATVDTESIAHGQHYLLDRPQPVDVPHERTVGILVWKDDGAVAERNETALWHLTEDRKRVVSESSSVPLRMVTDFLPLPILEPEQAAVPAEALETLRSAMDQIRHNGDDCSSTQPAVDFLAAIDASRGSAS